VKILFGGEFYTGKSILRYHIRNHDGGEGIWTRIDGAWTHVDSNGFNIQLDTMPFDGRITLRVASEKQSKG
jgi:hypothetical protein